MKLFKTRKNNRLFLLIVLLMIVGLVESALLLWKAGQEKKTPAKSSSTQQVAENNDSPKTNPQPAYQIGDAGSLQAIVNKGRALPSSYTPKSLVVPKIDLRLAAGSEEMYLRQEAAEALAEMVQAAKAAGVNLMLASGYRSYNFQKNLYGSYVSSQGQTQADRTSARPGHSEHQTGLAADLEPTSRQCEIEVCFGELSEGKWLAANAYKHGFIIRYPSGKASLTGYDYEPWHIRFVGKELAAQIQQSGQTLEQYFGLPAAQTYPAQIFNLK